MPTSRRTIDHTDELRRPQARVLAALMPEEEYLPHQEEWPTVSRAQLGVRAGYTSISGTLTRALNGVRSHLPDGRRNETVNAPHPGLLARKLVEEVVFDIEGRKEICYRITAAGIAAYRAHVAKNGTALPQPKERAICENDRYRARRLHADGQTVEQIAAALKTDVATVRRWLGQGASEGAA